MTTPKTTLALLLLLALTLFGVSGCTRQRPAQRFPDTLITLPPPTPEPMLLPRFTPHVTSTIPTPTPFAPPFVEFTPAPSDAPAAPPAPQPPTPTPRIHIVQPGETLYDIAVRYQVSLEALARTNNITDPTTIKPGDRLIIP